MSVQLKGGLALNLSGETPLIDVKNWVSQFLLNTARASVSTPATLGLDADTSAGERSDTLTIQFHSGVKAAEMWALLYEAITAPEATIDFKGTFDPGAVGVDNPQFAGTATLLSLDSGGTVGQLRQQTLTLPIKAGTLVKTTTP